MCIHGKGRGHFLAGGNFFMVVCVCVQIYYCSDQNKITGGGQLF